MSGRCLPVEDIISRHPVWRGGACARFAAPAVPTGFPELDRELPGGGWPGGALTELLLSEEGIGEMQLVLPALAALSVGGGRFAWIAAPHLPYAPAFSFAGVEPSCVAVVGVSSRADALWATEQVLRAKACRAVLLWLHTARHAELRRLVLAAEQSTALFFVVRPDTEAVQPSPACLRLALTARKDGISARILKRRGAPVTRSLHLAVERPVHAVGSASFPILFPGSTFTQACAV